MFALTQDEVADLFAGGKKELKEAQSLSNSRGLFQKSQQKHKRATYSKQKGVPMSLLESLEIEPSPLEPGKEEGFRDPEGRPEAEPVPAPEQEAGLDQQQERLEHLRAYFANQPETEPKCKQINTHV